MTQQVNSIVNPRTGQIMIFRQTGKETKGTIVEIETFNPPSTEKEPEHVHPKQESSMEVIAGKVHFRVNGKTQIVGPGEKIVIPAGVPHYFWNEEAIEAHAIQRFSPALEIDSFFRTYFALARDGKLNQQGFPNLLLLARVALHHQDDIRVISPPWIVQKIVFSLLAPVGALLGYKRKYE